MTTIEIPQNNFLSSRIEAFINAAGRLELEQVLKMFRLYGETTVMYHVKDLAKKCAISFDTKKNTLAPRNQPFCTDTAQRKLTTAFWVLAGLGDENIEWYTLTKSTPPILLMWLNANNHQLYDLTYIMPSYASTDCESWCRATKSLLPKGIHEEHCDHIALVFNEKDGQIALSYGFDRYCRLDSDKNAVFFPSLDEAKKAME